MANSTSGYEGHAVGFQRKPVKKPVFPLKAGAKITGPVPTRRTKAPSPLPPKQGKVSGTISAEEMLPDTFFTSRLSRNVSKQKEHRPPGTLRDIASMTTTSNRKVEDYTIDENTVKFVQLSPDIAVVAYQVKEQMERLVSEL